jgi:hypothetical protein
MRPVEFEDSSNDHVAELLQSRATYLQYSLLYPVLVNPVLSLVRLKTDGDKPVN